MTNPLRDVSTQSHPPVTGLNILIITSLLLFLGGCATAEKYSTADKDNAETTGARVQQLTTPAGNKYWYYPMPGADRTAIAITWSTDLPPVAEGQEAIPRLGIDLMLNGGAGGLDAEEIIADFEDLDSGSQLWVQPQEISGFIVSPVEHIAKASEIANKVLTQPNMDAKWFSREQKNLFDQAAERESGVFGLAWNLSREMSLADHPYKRFWSLRPIEGIKNIELEAVKNWHANAFSTAAMSITVAGNADSDQISSGIDQVLAGMSSQNPLSRQAFPAPDIPGKTVLLHQPDAEKSGILIIGNLPPHSAGNDIPLQLGLGVLGYGQQSRLFKAVRSGLRAAYGFGAGTFDMTREHTIMHISGEVETAKLQKALDETQHTYEKFRENGIGPIEFPVAKRFYVKRIREELKKPSSVAYMLMDAKLNQYGAEHMPNTLAIIKGQERSAVNDIVKQSLPAFESMLKIIVTPDKNAIADACVINDIDEWRKCL